MNERREIQQKITDAKLDVFFARYHHYGIMILAVLGTSSLITSVPISILQVLPQWASITMALSGAILGSTSVHELPVTKGWLNGAKQVLEEYKILNSELETVGIDTTINKEENLHL